MLRVMLNRAQWLTLCLLALIMGCTEEPPASLQETSLTDTSEAADGDDAGSEDAGPDTQVAGSPGDALPSLEDTPEEEPDAELPLPEVEDTAPEPPETEGGEDVEEDTGEAPFVCTDDPSCEGRIEVNPCQSARCVAGHCAALPDADKEGQACDDGKVCTTANVCQAGACSAGVPVDCSALANPPCSLGVCDPDQGGCIPLIADEGLSCDDGDPCTDNDQCSGGGCAGVSLCDDGDVCNGLEGCDPLTGSCTSGQALDCSGTDPCLGIAFCDATFGCVVGAPPDCGDFVCGAAGCPESCVTHEECVSGTYCAAGACLPTKADGESCEDPAMCESAHCESGLCCSGGKCCSEDSQCPLTEVDVLATQELFDASSGFARVVVTATTGGAQTLLAPASGVLERVDFMLQSNADEGYLLQVTVYDGDPKSGAPQLGTTTLLVVAPTAEPTLWTATFTSPIAVEADQTLGLGLSWLNGDADCVSNCAVIWLGAEENPYDGGQVLRTYDGGVSWQVSQFNDDLWFRIWAGQHSCENFSCEGAIQ